MLLEGNGNDLGQDTSFLHTILTERDIIFDKMLNDAILFCNNKEGERWKAVKEEIDD